MREVVGHQKAVLSTTRGCVTGSAGRIAPPTPAKFFFSITAPRRGNINTNGAGRARTLDCRHSHCCWTSVDKISQLQRTYLHLKASLPALDASQNPIRYEKPATLVSFSGDENQSKWQYITFALGGLFLTVTMVARDVKLPDLFPRISLQHSRNSNRSYLLSAP